MRKTSLPKLTPVALNRGSSRTGGLYRTADGRFIVWRHAAREWLIRPSCPSDCRCLIDAGLLGTSFETRRAAVDALGSALQADERRPPLGEWEREVDEWVAFIQARTSGFSPALGFGLQGGETAMRAVHAGLPGDAHRAAAMAVAALMVVSTRLGLRDEALEMRSKIGADIRRCMAGAV